MPLYYNATRRPPGSWGPQQHVLAHAKQGTLSPSASAPALGAIAVPRASAQQPPPPGGPPVERGGAARPSAEVPPPGDSRGYPPPVGGPPIEHGVAARPSTEVPPPGDSRNPTRPVRADTWNESQQRARQSFDSFYGYR